MRARVCIKHTPLQKLEVKPLGQSGTNEIETRNEKSLINVKGRISQETLHLTKSYNFSQN